MASHDLLSARCDQQEMIEKIKHIGRVLVAIAGLALILIGLYNAVMAVIT